jgi:hypothetical protein
MVSALQGDILCEVGVRPSHSHAPFTHPGGIQPENVPVDCVYRTISGRLDSSRVNYPAPEGRTRSPQALITLFGPFRPYSRLRVPVAWFSQHRHQTLFIQKGEKKQ